MTHPQRYGKDWSNDCQLFCNSPKGGFAEIEFEFLQSGRFRLEVVFTRAPDFGNVEASIDGRPLGNRFAGYAKKVERSGWFDMGEVELRPGRHTLRFTVVDQDKRSSNYRMGIDCLRLRASAGPAN
jgi:hypothetical protein